MKSGLAAEFHARFILSIGKDGAEGHILNAKIGVFG
jgi:hypothetical protein